MAQSYRDLDIYRERFRYFLDKYDELSRKISNFIKAVDSGHMIRT